jgi:maltose alpha-D-glucosyltransferase/alpha-amylase
MSGDWYRDAVIYEVHVRAYYDSDADGVGDFRGLTSKLEYLRDLGVTAIWLLPFYPSPLRDDGYDIADYMGVHRSYGTLRDLRAFLREARRQGLHVVTELVMNHTSDAHPWFQRARRSPFGDPHRDYYVWSDTPDYYRDARVIFKDFEASNWAWDPVAGAYYWHRFYGHQPDLNFDNPAVREEMLRIVDYWFEMGVDGMRLDAIPYLYERDGTTCENLPETHEFLRDLRAHVDARFDGKMLLAEANQWPEEAAAYFGTGDECHMAFHFPLMPRMFMAIQMEDRFPIIDILEQTPKIPEAAQWAMFLRNHDELTLEMVTDEERDYMYRMYASDPQARINLGIRRRLAPLLGGDRKTIELMNGLLFSMPGTPVVYYGDEIGMGDNIYLGDRNGVRTPMQWSADRNAGFSRANPQRLYLPVIIDPEYHAEAINVEAQQNNPTSLLWWMRRIIALRNRHKAFGRGSMEMLYPRNRKVLCFVRSHEGERVLVVANLSRQVQYVELDLSRFRGLVPVELFGQSEFPPIGDLPYFLTLGPHTFYWLALTPARVAATPAAPLRTLRVRTWTDLFEDRDRAQLEEVLPAYLRSVRWFGGKARRVKTAEVVEAVPVGGSTRAPPDAVLAFISVDYTEGQPETYVLPLTTASGERARELESAFPHSVVARLRVDG